MSDTVGETELAISDIIVIVLYFALVLFVGLWVRKNYVTSQHELSFLAQHLLHYFRRRKRTVAVWEATFWPEET